jgi:hypothetical protein
VLGTCGTRQIPTNRFVLLWSLCKLAAGVPISKARRAKRW